jgi:hypothetical protein
LWVIESLAGWLLAPAARGQHDADHQPRFQHFPKDNDQGCEHGAALFHDQMTAVIGVEIVEELVSAGTEWADQDGNLATGGDRSLGVEFDAFELRHGAVLVADDQSDLLTGRDWNLARNEFAARDRDHDTGIIGVG